MRNRSPLQHTLAPHLALVAVQLMFGSFPVVGKIVLKTFSSWDIVAFRVGGAALAFLALQRLTGSLRLERQSDYARFALYSLFGVVLNQIFFVKGLELTTATNTALLAVTIPVFATLVSMIFGFDKFSLRKIFGIFLAGAGVVYLIDPSQASFSSNTTLGDLLIVLNCLFYATYIAISKGAIERNGALKSIAWLFMFGSLICVPVGAYSLSSVNFASVGGSTWLGVAFLVLVPTIGAYFFNAWAMARVEPSTVAVYAYLQPLIGFALAVLFLGEHFTLRALLASLLIFVGVFLVTRARKISSPQAVHESIH